MRLIKNGSVLCIFLMFVTSSFGQSEKMQSYIKAVVKHAKEASLYQNNVDWKKLEAETYSKAKDAKTVEDLTPAFKHLLAELKDFHGRIIYKGKPIAFWLRKDEGYRKATDPKIWNVMQTGKYSFETKLLDNKIGLYQNWRNADGRQFQDVQRDSRCRLQSKIEKSRKVHS